MVFNFRHVPPKNSPIGSYRLDVISLAEECDWERYLPIEVRYIFNTKPAYKEKIKKILNQGKAIGVRSILKTPENVLNAIHAISQYSQENFIVTWLPDLLRDHKKPIFTAEDVDRAALHGCNLDAAVEVIVRDRLRFKRLVLIDEENIGISEEEQNLMTELSEIIYPLSIDYTVFRVIADNASERTEIAQTIVKALLFVGPVAHILEKYASGIGKLFAASADDLLGETAELMALRGSGFAWKELAKRSYILVPVFALATYGALSVEHFLINGNLIFAGVIFGLSAVALSLTTAIQSLFMYHKNIIKLFQMGKFKPRSKDSLLRVALRQDFTNPARLGLLVGAGMAPFMGILGAVTGVMHNGWVLAAIGSTESIVAGITVVLGNRINEHRFKKKLLRKII